MPSSDDINFAFGDQWGLLLMVWFGTSSGCGTIWTGTAFWFPFLLLYGLGLPSAFHSEYYTGLGLLSCFLFLSTIRVWDCLPYRVLYWFQTGSVLSQKCPTTVFKKL